MKRIVDPVHGNIYIEEKYFCFIDTKYFQRLRRIEQSSVRSIFPCARHDRFSHSIGVFHMGNLIVKQLLRDAEENKFYGISHTLDESREKYKVIVNSYLIACLLHDIAHAPFSHTFEKYYGIKSELCKKLNLLLNEKINFDEDDYDRVKEHEIVSAILVADKFRTLIEKKDFLGDYELVARMIIGQTYNDDNDIERQIRNCFISLLNGCIVDADRLDYACRDVWASGYKTASIDVERLVSNIYIRKELSSNNMVIAFDVNVVNEVLSLNEIRNFQSNRIFCHHTVLYEQYLFEKAAGKMIESIEDRDKGLNRIINYDTLNSEKSLKFNIRKDVSNSYKFHMIADEDLLFLMKQTENNKYYENWSQRNFTMYPLWKTEDEFFYKFCKDNRKLGHKNSKLIIAVKDILKENGFENDDVKLVLPIKKKKKEEHPMFYVILRDKKVITYPEYICNNNANNEGDDNYFYYVFVDKVIWKGKSDEEKNAIIDKVGNKILEMRE